ncbi:MAG TPA: hypothetical protein VD993_17870 [Chitinophagaceae bacterium]|nr:hypothetical protein [Chitinophagaceae bacterium]
MNSNPVKQEDRHEAGRHGKDALMNSKEDRKKLIRKEIDRVGLRKIN